MCSLGDFIKLEAIRGGAWSVNVLRGRDYVAVEDLNLSPVLV